MLKIYYIAIRVQLCSFRIKFIDPCFMGSDSQEPISLSSNMYILRNHLLKEYNNRSMKKHLKISYFYPIIKISLFLSIYNEAFFLYKQVEVNKV